MLHNCLKHCFYIVLKPPLGQELELHSYSRIRVHESFDFDREGLEAALIEHREEEILIVE